MRQKQIFLILALLCMVVQGAWAQSYNVWDGVTTTKPEFYETWNGHESVVVINTAAELAYVCQHFNEGSGSLNNKPYNEMDFFMEADLDMGDKNWEPLGWAGKHDALGDILALTSPASFQGTFFGNNHKIRINIFESVTKYQGLFGCIGKNGRVEHLTVEGRIAPDSRLVGGIAGENEGIIQDCVVKADVISGWEPIIPRESVVGGIVGWNTGTIRYCCMTGNVENVSTSVGGLVGANVSGEINHCTFYGKRISDSNQASIYAGTQSGTATNQHSSDLSNDATLESYIASFTHSLYNEYSDAIQYPYTVGVKNVGTGTVECSVERTRPGQTITLTKTSGNAVASLVVKDSDGTPISVNGSETDGWTFTMPSRDVSVTVAFKNEDGTVPDTGELPVNVWDGSTQAIPSYMETSTKTVHICSPAQLEYIRSHWSNVAMTTDRAYYYYECNYILDIDLDMTAKTWTPFGSTKYSGTFNGNGHTIRIKIEGDCDNYQGLFADIDEGGKVENLHVAGNIYCNNSRLVGGIAGCNRGTISNCWVSADVRSDWDGIATLSAYVGGICGENYYGTVEYCCMTGNVTNKRHYVAGIAGSNSYGTIKYCTFYGSLFNDPSYNTKGNKYVGWAYSEENCFDAFNQGQYDAADGKDIFRYALMYPYSVTVNTDGVGTVQTVIAYNTGATETYPDTEVTLEVTSGTAVGVTVTDADGKNITYDSSDETHYSFNMPHRNATVTVVFYDEAWAASGSGTEADPYIISSAEEWDRFANSVSNGREHDGKFVKLTADISVTSMAGINKGSSNTPEVYPFKGTFDGGGHTLTCHYNSLEKWTGAIIAPFRYVSNATIKNLKTAGAITTDAMCAAGIVGDATGSLNLTNCCSSVNISSTRPDIDCHGGLLASNRGDVTISGCVFDGSFAFLPTEDYTQHTNQYGTTFCGGIVGMSIENTSTSITNSLVAPSSVAEGMMSETFVGLYDGATVTVNNCYFVNTANLPTNQGSLCIFTNTAPSTLGTLVQDYGMVTAYANSIFYDGQYYIASTTLAGSGTEDDPYLINNTYEWDSFVHYVNEGTTYSGQYVKLTADINIAQKCGTVSGSTPEKAFSGTFLGDGHTITATITDTDNQGTALFSYINGATIKDLKVAGTINGGLHAAAIVGFAKGTGNWIHDCVATADVSGGTHIGGILGHGTDSSIQIDGSVFSGTMTGGGIAKGAIIGWGEGGVKTITDCLYLMADGQNTDGLDLVRQDDKGIVYDGNCYKTTKVGSYGAQCFPVADDPSTLGEVLRTYDVLTAYEKGILYDGTYYPSLLPISLADNADNSATISTADGYSTNVTLQGRTLYKDGSWNTLCLPFSVDDFNGTPLQGATVKTLASTTFSDGTLTMNFSDDLTSIEAGKPYIVKWDNNVVNLSTLTTDYTAQNGDVLTGTLGGDYKILIAAGAIVTLHDATINGEDKHLCVWAGITCQGDATIILKGENTVKGFYRSYPGIYVPSGSTLTIVGSGVLNASSSGQAAGIGGGQYTLNSCGNIVIEGGTINAVGGGKAAGIGGGQENSCGDITITDGVTKVTATKGADAPNSIGAGSDGTCCTVTIGGTVGAITTSPYTYTGNGTGGTIPDVKLADIVNPVFNNVTISNVTANIETDYVDFLGTYAPVSIYTVWNVNLYLGADNTLYYPTVSNFTVNAFRGYFLLKEELKAGETSPNPSEGGGNQVRAFKLYFDDNSEVTTGIKTIDDSSISDLQFDSAAWYSLDGRKLNGKPTQRGIYVNNGRKIIIK